MKTIPVNLLSHLSGMATTWCYLMRVACVGSYAGVIKGFTSLDVNLTYDDGDGPVLYRADNGFMPAKFQQEATFAVGNSEVEGWVTDAEISERDILSGMFDFAEVTVYRVNYNSLSDGHEVVAFGTLGETQFSGASWKCEFRSLTQQTRQPYGNVFCLTCRNIYGDAKCKKAFEWVEATVTSVDTDANRVLVAGDLVGVAEGHFSPGVLEVLTGENAGADMDVDESYVDGRVVLALPLPFAFAVGDMFRIRGDCDKQFSTCKAKGNHLEFRGEHLTPVSSTNLATPGAYVKDK